MVAGRLFVGDRVYFALYPEASHLHMGVPPDVEDKLTRCANIQFQSHIKNAKKDRTIGIDLFLLRNKSDYSYVSALLDDDLKERHGERNLRVEETSSLIRNCGLDYDLKKIEADSTFGIRWMIQAEFRDLKDEIMDIARADITKFSKYRRVELVVNDNPTSVSILEEILQPTITKRLDHAQIELGTKSQVHPFCYQDLTIDFTRGCKSYEEVVVLKDGSESAVFNLWLGCDYCYNKWVNRHHFSQGYHPVNKQQLVEQIKKFKKTDFKNKKISALRIGSGTECFNPELIDYVIATIEAANEQGIPVILPTKTPFFDKHVADFLKHHRVNLMISLGSDALELGVQRQGFPNKQRIELARQYHEFRSEKFKVVLYPLTDLATHPREQKLWSAREAYRINQEEGIPLQFLIFRTSSSKLLAHVTDKAIFPRIPKAQKALIKIPENGYYLPRREEDAFYIPLHYHPFFQDIIEKGEKKHPAIGICSIVSSYSACGACLVPGLKRRKGKQEKKPLQNIDDIKEEKRERARKVKAKHDAERHAFQGDLFEK
jgi:hypothetical protein